MGLNHDDALRVIQASGCKPEWATGWHVWTVIVPRRTINGRLTWGRVWRRHDGRGWIYKKLENHLDLS
jgi:ribosomal protein L35AE/L33A